MNDGRKGTTMQLLLMLHSEHDAVLIEALQAIPPTEREARIRHALMDCFVKAPEIAQAIQRLADVLEVKTTGIPVATTASTEPTDLTQADPQKEVERKVAISLFKNFGAWDDDDE